MDGWRFEDSEGFILEERLAGLRAQWREMRRYMLEAGVDACLYVHYRRSYQRTLSAYAHAWVASRIIVAAADMPAVRAFLKR